MEVTEELRERLLHDTPFWARHCAKVLDRERPTQLVPLIPNTAQLEFDRKLEAQRLAGRPMRGMVLKSRKRGFSTWGVTKSSQRMTQIANTRALVVGQDNDTAGVLFQIADRIYRNLPDDPELALKPHRINFEDGKYMKFGERSRLRRAEGIVGLDSTFEIDTANEKEAGRGYTPTDLLCTEVAFWPDPKKLISLLNAVPDSPDTMVILESTANGLNHWHERWEAAEAGESEYFAHFSGWTDDPANTLPFRDAEHEEEFIAGIGEGPWGEDEPHLISHFGCTPEQLHWRRKTIVDKADSKIEYFKQEYPAVAEEAFILSGKQVFSVVLVARVREEAEQSDPVFTSPDNPGPQIGTIRPGGEPGDVVERTIRGGTLEVPKRVAWTPKVPGGAVASPWRVWEQPDPGDDERARGAYIVAVDPAGGEENEKGELAWHAIQVIDHRSKAQVAEWRSRIDPDLIAEQALLAALLYNKALIAIEVTGGYGGFIARKLRRDYGYPLVYRRRPLSKDRDKQEEVLGWATTPGTKPYLEGRAAELLRTRYGDDVEEVDPSIVRSRVLAREFATYIRDERGKTGPQGNAFSDLLMAWMIGQQIAHERPVPSAESQGSTTSTVRHRRRRPRDPVTGY